MNNNLTNKGTAISSLHYNFVEKFYYFVVIIASPFLFSLIASLLTLYFAEDIFIKHHILSTYINNLFDFTHHTIVFNNEEYSKKVFNNFAEEMFEKTKLINKFYYLMFVYYVTSFYPIYFFTNKIINRKQEEMKDKHLRGSKVLSAEEYAKKHNVENGILLSFVYKTNLKKDKNLNKEIFQFKNGEVQNVRI